jgi:hypothetical protein
MYIKILHHAQLGCPCEHYSVPTKEATGKATTVILDLEADQTLATPVFCFDECSPVLSCGR